MNNYPTDELRQAAPTGGVFDAQKKPSKKAVEALKQWRDKEAESDLEKEWVDAALQAVRDARRSDW